MLRLTLVLSVCALIAGCSGGGSSGGSSSAKTYSLFNFWLADDNSLLFTLKGGSYNGASFIGALAVVGSGETCTCSISASGDDSSGNFTTSNCSYSSGGSGDPGCSSLDQYYTYTKSGSSMELCDPGGCESYSYYEE